MRSNRLWNKGRFFMPTLSQEAYFLWAETRGR